MKIKHNIAVAAAVILNSPLSILHSHAAVPLRWTVETSRVQPAVFDVVHGESIELEAAMQSYGNPLSMAGKPVFIFWQTNGMNTAWWSAPAQVRTASALAGGAATTNVLAATFTPAMDPGAPTVTGFIGATGDIYRAAFTLRFRKGPGAVPNAITMPPPVLDLANTVVINPPWPTKEEFAATSTVMKAELKTYVDYKTESAVTNIFTNGVSAVTRKVARIFIPSTNGLSTVRYVDDATNSAYISAKNAANEIITNHVTSGYLCTLKNNNIVGDHFIIRDSSREGGIEFSELANDYKWKFSGYLNGIASYASVLGDPADRIVRLPPRIWRDMDGKWKMRKGANQAAYEIASKNDIPDSYTRAASDARYAPTSTAVTVASHTSQLSQMSQSLSGKAEAAIVTQLSQSLSAKAEAATVAQLNIQVQALGANANAEDARVIVTNYNSATKMPEAQFDVKVSNSWITVWHEMTRWNWFLGGFTTYTNGVTSTLANKGEKEWGWFDSATGNPSPDGILQLSQPRIQVCSGAAYQRYVSTTGSVWVLESNGLVADINGTTNGYFRITDEEGNAHFEIVKGDKQSLFATAKTMTQQQMGVTHYFTTYAITNAVTTPVAQFSRSLNPATWIKETESGCPCNVSWTNNGDNSWTVEWWPIGNEPVLFMMAGYEKGGETYIRNVVPVQMQYIYLGNTKYLLGTATISGHTVLTLTAQ